MTAVLESLPATVAAWSDGLAALEPLDVIEVRRPLATPVVERRWPLVGRPARLSPELVEHAPDGRYDSILVLWPCAPDVAQCGWGCTHRADTRDRQGRVHVDLDRPLADARHRSRTRPRAMSTSGSTRSRRSTAGWGSARPSCRASHEAGSFTSTRDPLEPPFGRSYAEYHDGSGARAGARTWAPWYRDWMTGRLRPIAPMALTEAPAPRSASPRNAGRSARRKPAPPLRPPGWAS